MVGLIPLDSQTLGMIESCKPFLVDYDNDMSQARFI